MSLFSTLDIAASGLSAQRLRIDLIAGNLANAHTTRTESGGPFRRQMPIFQARGYELHRAGGSAPLLGGGGVRVLGIVEDQSPLKQVYDPTHPDADPDGYVYYPNVDPVLEMADLIAASRAFEANLAVMEASKQIITRTLTIGR
jgi:flagellar basal-body rod protein FlgC